jgi:hypothetical protein
VIAVRREELIAADEVCGRDDCAEDDEVDAP